MNTMKRNSKTLWRLTLLLTFLASQLEASAQGHPSMMNYQGRLHDAAGNPVTQSQKMQFKIYDAASEGNLIWGPFVLDHVPMSAQGEFNVVLGPLDSSPSKRSLAIAFVNNQRTFLGVATASSGQPFTSGEVTPRQEIFSAPFALSAGLPAGYIRGALISNSGSNDTLHVGSALCRSEDDGMDISTIEMAKSVSEPWEPTSGGGLDAGTVGSSPVIIYVWAIAETTGAVPSDILLSKSATEPTMPSVSSSNGSLVYTAKRLLGGRLWTGDRFAPFMTTGTSNRKTVAYESAFEIGTWTDSTSVLSINVVPERICRSAIVYSRGWWTLGGATLYVYGNNASARGQTIAEIRYEPATGARTIQGASGNASLAIAAYHEQL